MISKPHKASFANSQVIPGKEAKHDVFLNFSCATVDAILVLDHSSISRGDIVLRVRRSVQDTPDIRKQYAHFSESSDGLVVCDPIRSPFDGEVVCSLHEGQLLSQDDLLFSVVELCGHAVQFGNLCALCGKSLAPPGMISHESLRANISMAHDGMDVTVSQSIACNLDMENADRLRKEKKLSLVLDLDQTLVHATADPAVGAWMTAVASETPDSPLLHDLYRFFLEGSPDEHYLRLRPSLRQFLLSVQERFELHIYTMGSRPYANSVAAIIDPTGALFKERVLSRDESGSHLRKSLQRLFPCDQSMVVVVDDQGDMWGWSSNLIRVHPYRFFVATGDINAPHPNAFSPAPVDGSLPIRVGDNDKELAILMGKLHELHTLFYKGSEQDVRKILPAMKAKVLDGCVLHFCENLADIRDCVILASMFGASCEEVFSDKVTHLVAKPSQITKIHEAHRRGIPAVSYSWLFTSISYWSLLPVERFEIPCLPEKCGQLLDDASEPESCISGIVKKGVLSTLLDKNIFTTFQDKNIFIALDEELREWMGDDYQEVAAENDEQQDEPQPSLKRKIPGGENEATQKKMCNPSDEELVNLDELLGSSNDND